MPMNPADKIVARVFDEEYEAASEGMVLVPHFREVIDRVYERLDRQVSRRTIAHVQAKQLQRRIRV